MDVLNKKQLKSAGYDPKKYYCGNYSFQKYWTKFRDALKKEGIRFPYNEACFIHDRAYSKKPNRREKLAIDYKFFTDMITLLNTKAKTSAKVRSRYKRLYARAVIYYILVLAMTSIYIKQGKIKK